jgi:hypothetical protein
MKMEKNMDINGEKNRQVEKISVIYAHTCVAIAARQKRSGCLGVVLST